MLVPHGDDRDRFQIRVGEHFVVVGIYPRNFEPVGHFFEAFLPSCAQGEQFYLGQIEKRFAMLLTKPTEADHAELDAFHMIPFPPPKRATPPNACGGSPRSWTPRPPELTTMQYCSPAPTV